MKIDVRSIVSDHWKTLCAGQNPVICIGDFLLFYGVPICVAGWAYKCGFKLSAEGYNVSITFFGIFIALLLNIQVAIFAIFQRKWDEPETAIEKVTQDKTRDIRRRLLSELNANISYLVLVCCSVLVAAVWFYMADLHTGAPPALTIALYGHFLLTLLMVVKRSHALFQYEYQR